MPFETLLPDIPRIYTAVSEWLACMIFVVFSVKRFDNLKTAVLSVAALVTLCIFHWLAGEMPLWSWIPCMLVAVAGMCLFIWGARKLKFHEACYAGIQAFVIAEFVSALEWWLYYFFASTFTITAPTVASVMICALIYLALYALLLVLERRYAKRKTFPPNYKDLLAVAVIACAVFLISNISFLGWDTPISSKYPLEIFYIRTLVDFCGVLILYSAREQKISAYVRTELAQIQLLLDKQYEQYRLTKETIEIVNRKHHDLKHSLAVLKNGTERAGEYASETEHDIKPYDAVFRTGNDVLDTILMGKSIKCEQSGITFTCVADGGALSFMSDMDICSLFGNALDNAIESFDGATGDDAKFIKLAVYKSGELLIVKCENTFNGKVTCVNGDLISTKGGRDYRGFGIKSIKAVAEKYGGSVSIAAQPPTFTICAVFPRTEEEKSED